ncbi:MAG: PadR family transcriptional regulator [Vulcanimicrobiaceae bacterium]
MFRDFERHGHHFRHRKRMRRVWEAFEAASEQQRMRRGDVKYALLSALLKRPMHGYDVMQELEEASGGRYRPSPGSVYPTLQMLEDGGFVTSQVPGGKRVYEITGAGRTLLDERPRDDAEEGGSREWDEMRETARKFAEAMRQGFTTFDPQTREKIRQVIDNARREIFTILAERG